MTKENVYQYYLKWKKGKNIWEVNDLFKSPSGNERQNGANPHEYRVFDLSLCLVILV